MTNEEYCAFIARGDSDELKPLLWNQVKNLYHEKARSHYYRCRKRAIASGVELDDCYQASYLAFIDALNDYTKEPQTVKFSSFATFHIKNNINKLLGVRTSRRDPLNNCLSLDEPQAEESEDFALADTIADENAPELFVNMERLDICRVVNESVQNLDKAQKEVVKARYYERRNLNDTAVILSIPVREVRRLERGALHKLRSMRELRVIGADCYGISTGLSSFRRHGSSVEILVEWNEQRMRG